MFQRLVVLDRGTAVTTLQDASFFYRFDVTYLLDEDPARLVANPALAPFAVLARADGEPARADALRRAFRTIRALPDPDRQELGSAAALLAGIHLDPATITAVTQEAGMQFTLDEDTVAGRAIAAQHFARGETRGLARGAARGPTRNGSRR